MEVGLMPILKTMVLKTNAHELWEMKRFVETWAWNSDSTP